MKKRNANSSRKKSLLQMAKAASSGENLFRRFSKQDVELAFAWARGDVETYQVAAAKNFPKKGLHGYVYKYIAECFAFSVRTKMKG